MGFVEETLRDEEVHGSLALERICELGGRQDMVRTLSMRTKFLTYRQGAPISRVGILVVVLP